MATRGAGGVWCVAGEGKLLTNKAGPEVYAHHTFPGPSPTPGPREEEEEEEEEGEWAASAVSEVT